MFWYSLLRSYPVWSLLGVTGAAYLRNRHLMRLRAKALFEQIGSQELLLEWQARYGYNAHGLVSISADAHSWRDPQGRGAVCYQDIGRTWLASGEPFAAAGDISEVATGFIKAARRAGKLPAFVPVT